MSDIQAILGRLLTQLDGVVDGASSFVLEDDGFSPVSAPLSDQPGSPFPPSSPPLAQSSPVDDNSYLDDNSYPRNVDSLDGLTFSSYDDGEAYIAQRAEEADFAIVKRRSRNRCLTIPGGYRYHDIECYMARFSESKAQSDRHSTAVRCGCPWKGTFQYCDGLWKFTLKHREHNHVKQKGSEIPANRRRHRDMAVRARVMELSRAFRARAVDIAKQVSKEMNVTVTPKDVQNIRDAEGVKSRENFTATQCFFRELRRDEDCIVEYKLDERNRPVYVLFTFKSCVEVWKENPEVLMMDNTYKTNCFELPLMEITGSTGLNTTFSVAWCLMSGEKVDDYRWVLSHLTSIIFTHGLSVPDVVITDFDKALLRAWSEV